MKPHDRKSVVLPLLLVLFVGSGCAALICEIVWFQLLQLVIGSSAVSLGVLLGTFMGGMCLGSLLFPRLISSQRHPLRVYAFLELGIGVSGILILFGIPYISGVYVASIGHGYPGILLRGVVCGACLLVPTLFMGATLPAIARWVEATPRGVSWLGFFYGGNIAGAVFGCLLAGFYLLRLYDMATAAYVAIGINAAVALLGLGLAELVPHEPSTDGPAPDRVRAAPGAWRVYLAIAISGLTALAAEVIWTRLLSLMLGATVYTFSIILAVFLVGLGVGSTAGSLLARWVPRPRLVLGICQFLLAAAIAWAAWSATESLPYWPIDDGRISEPWYVFRIDFQRCLWAILPPTILWGASFPLALAAVASRGQDTGRMVGGVYAANTAGAIAGALIASLWLIRWAGTQMAEQILIGVSAAVAVLLFAPLLWPHPDRAAPRGAPSRAPLWGAWAAVAVAALAVAATLVERVPELPWELVAWGRQYHNREENRKGEANKIDLREGLNSSVVVSENKWSKCRNFHVAGKIEASTLPEDMRLQRMLGHLSALACPKPRSVLVVGCGAGVTAGCFVMHPEVERIVICEIEPMVPQVVSTYFAKENYGIVNGIDQQNPIRVRGKEVEVVYDDARHFILTTSEKFDIITSDPIHPWVKGAANLYTKEYFELCKRRLNPGGVVTQWVPLYESDFDTVKSELATFFDAFPDGTIWGNTYMDKNGRDVGYDVVLLGQVEQTRIDVAAFHQRWYGDVKDSLNDVWFYAPADLLRTYAGCGSDPDMKEWLQDAQINRDRNLRLQYLAGRASTLQQGREIYYEILKHGRYPEEFFIGPDD